MLVVDGGELWLFLFLVSGFRSWSAEKLGPLDIGRQVFAASSF